MNWCCVMLIVNSALLLSTLFVSPVLGARKGSKPAEGSGEEGGKNGSAGSQEEQPKQSSKGKHTGKGHNHSSSRLRRSILPGALDFLLAPLKTHLLDMKESLKSPNSLTGSSAVSALTSPASALSAATAYLSSLPLVSSYDYNLLPFSVGRQCDTRVLLDAQYGQCRALAAEYWQAAEFNVASSPIDSPRLCCFVWARLACMEDAVRRVCSDPYSRNNFIAQSSTLKTRLESPMGTLGTGICYWYQSSSLRCQLPAWHTVFLLTLAFLFAISFFLLFFYLLRGRRSPKSGKLQYSSRDDNNNNTKVKAHYDDPEPEVSHGNGTGRRYQSKRDHAEAVLANSYQNGDDVGEFGGDATYRATPVSVYLDSPRTPTRAPSPHHVRYAYINKSPKQVTI